ncbi:MAG TPA: hypothetical protein VGR47_21720 [Terracidiphilus sp.]|nr:hypothetical protein [Terracidiphilus sp.]
MHIYIPLWLCWTGGVAVVLAVGVAVGFIVVIGLRADKRDLEVLFREPYPDPREGRVAQPPSN